MKLRIGILGTRGIPNHYGGFEQFAEYISVGLANKGHEVFVYNSHNHPHQEDKWKNVHIVHCHDPENKLGTAGQFLYDLNCILDARKRKFDIILMLGFTSSSVWGWLFPSDAVTIFNMDGLEWKRTKYRPMVQKFLLYAERLAIKYGNYYIADSEVIRTYLYEKYKVNSRYISYGAEVFLNDSYDVLAAYDVEPYDYYMMIARMEPENNIETVLDGFAASSSMRHFVVVGSTSNKFGKHLLAKFSHDTRIRFVGAIYNNPAELHALRKYSYMYFHGHSVGGTNPSLLEAMASQALIVAHDNPFNKAILDNEAYYFSSPQDVCRIIENTIRGDKELLMMENNLEKIQQQFSWHHIIEKYESYMLQCVGKVIPLNSFPRESGVISLESGESRETGVVSLESKPISSL
jgi:glycosyltransferase involved in cell wall biosynthesis